MIDGVAPSSGSDWGAGDGVAAGSGVGASTSIELPTIATLFGSVSSLGRGSRPYKWIKTGKSSSPPCSAREMAKDAKSAPVDGFTAALISDTDNAARRRFQPIA